MTREARTGVWFHPDCVRHDPGAGHHGNGTQEIFYEDRDVYYISLHESPLYPGTGEAR